MAGRSHMSEVDSDLVILNEKLMGYLTVGLDNTVDLAQNVAEYCSDDAGLKQKTEDIMKEFIQMEHDIKQNVAALRHVKSVGINSGNEVSLVTMFKEKLQEVQRDERQGFRDHPKYAEMEEAFSAAGDLEEQLEALRATLVGSVDSDEVAMTQSEVNIKCPYTGQTMVNPVRNVHCNHVYDKDGILEYIRVRKSKAKCPVGGCGNTNPIKAEHLEEHKDMKKYITLLAKRTSS